MARPLIESTFVTLDGVIENPQDWSPPYWDDDHHAYTTRLMDRSDALLLGRATYEGFAASWPQRSGDPFTEKINAMPKHVASRTLTDTTWNASVLQGDVATAVAELKAQPGGALLKYGTGELDRTLLEHRLVDEYHFWIFPVIAGRGQRLLVDGPLTHLQLVDTTPFASGIVVLTYAPKG
jgi:dihydrofolate reductase